jgi:hypothetical protein
MFSGKSLTRSLGAVGLVAALAAGALLQGCGSESEDRPAQWSYIYPAIIQPSCATASCHSDFTRRAGVNLGDEAEAWRQLVCRHFVQAGNSKQSEVVFLMNAQGANRMPPDFALPEQDINLISTWIDTNGAADDIQDTNDPACAK